MGTLRTAKPRNPVADLDLTAREQREYAQRARDLGFASITEYMRHLHARSMTPHSRAATEDYAAAYPARPMREFYKPEMGRMMLGDARARLFHSTA